MESDVQISVPTRGEVVEFMRLVRPEQRFEIDDPEWIVDLTELRHETYLVHYRGEPALLFGVVLFEYAAVVWMYGTALIEKAKFLFHRTAKALMADLRAKYFGRPLLVMACKQHQGSQRWLERLGFVPTRWTLGKNGLDYVFLRYR